MDLRKTAWLVIYKFQDYIIVEKGNEVLFVTLSIALCCTCYFYGYTYSLI
jgi:hypothetical protein